MNVLKSHGVVYKLESIWRDNKQTDKLDSENKSFPWPVHNTTLWQNKDSFIDKLTEVEKYANNNKMYKYYKTKKSCKLDNKPGISTKMFIVNNIVWEDGLKHYITAHNLKPDHIFVDFIFKFHIPGKNKKIIKVINGTEVIIYDKKYLKISRNQMLILDALMEHGGVKKYIDKNHEMAYKYSEHSGLLDFNKHGLEKIIVSAKHGFIDNEDETIFLPQNMPDAFDYEFMFHTHPPTPKPGGRVTGGILFEFPSISDLFHFIEHYNNGNTQGSIIIASEGLYIIRKFKFDDKAIKINEDDMHDEMHGVFWSAQQKAIQKYGKKFDKETFYSKIAQDVSYIKNINMTLNKYKLHIDYFPRIKGKDNKWVIDTLFIPVFVHEPTLQY